LVFKDCLERQNLSIGFNFLIETQVNFVNINCLKIVLFFSDQNSSYPLAQVKDRLSSSFAEGYMMRQLAIKLRVTITSEPSCGAFRNLVFDLKMLRANIPLWSENKMLRFKCQKSFSHSLKNIIETNQA